VEAIILEPERLPVRQRRLLDALSARRAGFDLAVGDAVWRVEPLARVGEPVAQPVLAARAGEAVWQVALDRTRDLFDLLALPDDVDRDAIPDTVLWAVAEARLEGLLGRLEQLSGAAVRLVDPREAQPGPACWLEFTLAGPEGQALRGWVGVPLDEDCLATLERTLDTLPRVPSPLADLPLELGVEVGRMRLTLRELRGVEPGDVLLPAAWHPAEGCVYLSAPPLRVRVPWPDSAAGPWTEVNDRAHQSEESDMADKDEAQGLGAVEVELGFEIGRVRMTVDELSDLGEGRTLDLPNQAGPGVEVAILGGGRRIGTGRIVSVGQGLGIQIVSLPGRES